MKKTVRNFYQHFWHKPGCILQFFLFVVISPKIASGQIDTVKKLKDVTVKSSKALKLREITPSQTVTSKDFNRFNALDVADAITDFAGVIIKDYGGIGGLKTVSVRGLGANHTEVIYDGVAISDAENGQIDLGKFNLYNVQEITLYNGQPSEICMPARSFASASVLAIKTTVPNLIPTKPYQFNIGVSSGSYGLISPHLQYQQRLNNRWYFVLNGYAEHANNDYGYTTNNGNTTTHETRLGSQIAVQQVDGSLYWFKTDSNKFNLHTNFYNSNQGLPGAVILYTPPPNGQHEWQRDFFIQAGYERIWKNSLHLLLNAKLSQDYLRYFDPHYAAASGQLNNIYTQHEVYQSAALAYHLTPYWEVSYAVDLSLADIDANLNVFDYPTRFTLQNVIASNLTIGKVLLQGSLLNTSITEHVKSGEASPSRNIFSPTVMASYKPLRDPGFQLRAFYKYIFRDPTFSELYYSVVLNPDLKPEFTNQYDIGFTYKKGLTGLVDYVTWSTDLYYNDIVNKIVFNPGFDGAQNYGKVDIKGMDVSVKTQADIGSGFKLPLTVNYSYQSALNVTNPATSTYLNQLPYIPKNTIAINAGITRSSIGIFYNQIISSHRYYNNNNLPDDLLPAYSISEASVVYKSTIQKSHVVASLGVDNLFNKNYVVVQSYPMPGRYYKLSFQITI